MANGDARREQGTYSGIVKWYSHAKGYGFIESASVETDVLVHFSVLDVVGIRSLRPNDKITFEAKEVEQGFQVSRILSLSPQVDVLPEPQHILDGVFKWFSRTKGFGFMVPDQMNEEVFIHATTLQRSGLLNVSPGTRVQADVIQGKKGLEATTIRVISSKNGSEVVLK